MSLRGHAVVAIWNDVVPEGLDAFYEWHRSGTGKTARSQPYLCRRTDGETMGLAALWETWTGPNGEEVDTACIVTTEANALSGAIHPRLPVVLERADWATWLNPDDDATGDAQALLRSPGDDVLAFVPISSAVNKVDHDDPSVQEAVGPSLQLEGQVQPARLEVQLGLL